MADDRNEDGDGFVLPEGYEGSTDYTDPNETAPEPYIVETESDGEGDQYNDCGFHEHGNVYFYGPVTYTEAPKADGGEVSARAVGPIAGMILAALIPVIKDLVKKLIEELLKDKLGGTPKAEGPAVAEQDQAA